MNVAELHAILESQVAAGHGAVPVCVSLVDDDDPRVLDLVGRRDWLASDVFYVGEADAGTAGGFVQLNAAPLDARPSPF